MFQVGQQFGFYTLIRQLGRGGFGEVWLAKRHTRFVTTQVAVKLPLDEQVDHAAIEQEAQLWAQASGHANVLPIIEANEYDGQILIVSEYAEDGSIEELLHSNGGVLPVKQAVEMTIGILKGLGFLHSRKIIHRDIKPANILLQGDTPRLADFGISRVLKTTSLATNVVGTPYYMAPEAFQRKRNAQTDVWSVGVMLYQMLNGTLPFLGDNITDLFGAIILSEPEPLPDSIPIKLREIVLKALSKDIAERYQTAREMRDELDEVWRRLSPSVVAPTQEPIISTKADEQMTVEISVRPPATIRRPKETEQPGIVPDNRPVLPSATPVVKAKTKRLYFVIPAVGLLLVAIIAVGYWLRHKMPGNTMASNNTNTSPVTASSPNVAADPLLIPFLKGDKWGFSDTNKKLIIEAKYDNTFGFIDGLAPVKLNNKWGYVDQTGQEVIPLKYDAAFTFIDRLATVQINNKYGFIDQTGQEVIPLKYDNTFGFIDGLAAVKLNNKYGYVDKRGNLVIPLKYDTAFGFSDGLATVKRNNKYGYVDKMGQEVIPLKYDNAFAFIDGLAPVKLNNKWGYIDKTGNLVTRLKYDAAFTFSDRLATVQINNKQGWVDQTGQEVIPLKYDTAFGFSDGLATVKRNNKYGYVDKTGQEVIPLKYDTAFGFSDGRARVKLNNKWGYIDKTGNLVIPLKYTDADAFSNGLARVQLNGKYGFVDQAGREVIPLKYDNASSFTYKLTGVVLNGKGFVIDKNSTEYYEP